MNIDKEQTVLVFNKFCPFAQRALIVALEKDMKFTLKHASLGKKEDFFKQIYSKAYGRDPSNEGKVPILIHNGNIMTQSDPICWYMAETFDSGYKLIPQDTFQRVKMRKFIYEITPKMIKLFYDAKSGLNTKQFLEKEKDFLMNQIQDFIELPFVLDQFSLADALIYPWFERWIILQYYFGLQINKKYKKIQEWIRNLNFRESIKKTKDLTNNEYYIKRAFKMMTNQSKL